MIVTAKPFHPLARKESQIGIALLQVLLISAVISLLAIRFTTTAQNQLEMALHVDLRVKAELKAKSVLNEVIFLQLSETVRPNDPHAALVFLPAKSSLNRYGETTQWSEKVQVVIQDMNGLLPQMFINHAFWKPALLGLSFSEQEVEEYLGTWRDMQDHDLVSWDGSGEEPSKLSNGGLFLNGYAQNDKLLLWLFSDQPEALEVLQEISDINALFETNLLNSPHALLSVLLEPTTLEGFSAERRLGDLKPRELGAILPDIYKVPGFYLYNSNDLRISVRVRLLNNTWLESQVISLTAGSNVPFEVRLIH